MKSIFIDLMEGFIWLVVIILIGGGAFFGFEAGVGNVRGGIGLAVGGFLGACAAALLCGPAFLLLSMNDHLKSIAAVEK